MSTRRQARRTRRTQLSPAPQEDPKIMPHDPHYKQHLMDCGVSFMGGPKPKNLQELKTRLGTRRPSLSGSRFSQQDFEKLERYNQLAETEAEALANVLPIIKGNSTLFSCQKRIFNNLKPLDNKFAAATPDFYDGSLSENLDPRVRNDLEDLIVPCKDFSSTLLPNFFLEMNGSKGDAESLILQLTRDLVCGARAMLAIQSYSNGDRSYDGNAYTIGSSYNGASAILKFYTVIVTQPADPTERPTYHMIKIKTFDLTEDAETCRDGINWFRNARDFAKDVRDGAIASANRVAYDRTDRASASASTNYPLVSSFPNGVSGLVPGSWLGGPSTSQAQEPPITGGTASNSGRTGHEEPARAADGPSEDADPF